jgi:hypothetical protein
MQDTGCTMQDRKGSNPGTWDPGPDQHRGPDTEDRAQRAHRVCILYPAAYHA